MFGGMPTYQVTGSLPSGQFRNSITETLHLGFAGKMEAIGLIFAYFFGFFLMLICFGVNPWLSIIGGFALGLSSYFFLIIPAGHMTKATALGLLGPMIGGFYAIMRRKYWLGIPLFCGYHFPSADDVLYCHAYRRDGMRGTIYPHSRQAMERIRHIDRRFDSVLRADLGY